MSDSSSRRSIQASSTSHLEQNENRHLIKTSTEDVHSSMITKKLPLLAKPEAGGVFRISGNENLTTLRNLASQQRDGKTKKSEGYNLDSQGANPQQTQQIKSEPGAANGDDSSNYEVSIFEDDDEDSSSDKDEESYKLSRRSLGAEVIQDHNKSATIIDQQIPDTEDEPSSKEIKKNDDEVQVEAEAGVEAEEDTKQAAKPAADYEPMPLIKSGVSIAADLRFGWRPVEKELHGAPIPLHYDYEQFTVPKNPATNRLYQVLYFGPRIQTSYDVHKKFANIENLTTDQCPDPRLINISSKSSKADAKTTQGGPPANSDQSPAQEPYPSYPFKFPLRMPVIGKQEFDDPPPFVGMNPKLAGQLNDEFIFDSAFESGNLDMVIKSQPVQNQYDLYMRVDTNTRGHHQWFYFSVQVPASFAQKTIKFRVVNFTKPMSLYTSGMRVCYARKSQNYHWQKGGKNITYGRSNVVRRPSQDPARVIYYSMLTFEFDMGKHRDNEKIFFAYCYPYTFTQLTHFLRGLSVAHKDSEIYKESVLCKSLSGVDVPLITITSRMKSDPKCYNQIKLSEFEDDDSKLSLPMYKKKKYAIITSRVHPGESNSSYMMQGFIKYLLGDSHQAKQLRKRVVFKLVPMINIDGVIIGNYRTSMSGNDLNRRYVKPDFRIHPVVCAIKQLANDLVYGPGEESKKDADEPEVMNEEIMAFIDMHGHSRKKNVFIYGPQEPLHSANYLRMRIIPKLIAEETQKFRYHSCRFRLDPSKLKAARIVMWREFNITNCFTFEASFHGHFDHMNYNKEFTCAEYEEMGEHLANSFFEYLMIMEEEERRRKLLEIAKKKKKKQRQLAMQPSVITTNNQGNASLVGSAGSSKDVQSAANQLSLPPSGKLGKKGVMNPAGSSSSRARNVSHVTNKDSDKEVHNQLAANITGKESRKVKKNAETKNKEKSKKKNIAAAKSETPNSVYVNIAQNLLARSQGSSDPNSQSGNPSGVIVSGVGTTDVTNNPNEPPNEDLCAPDPSGIDTQDQQSRSSNIQVGSHDLREINRFASMQINSYDDDQQTIIEMPNSSDKPEPKKRIGFRNLKDMFAAVRAQEKQRPSVGEESDAYSDTSEEVVPLVAKTGTEGAEKTTTTVGEGGTARIEEEDDDELSNEQQRKLHGSILNVITQFVKVNNYKEHEYYGVSEQTLKKQKKLRKAENAAAAEEAKRKLLEGAKTEGSAVNSSKDCNKATKSNKKEKGRLKRHSHQKESLQASSNHNQGVNYQSKTLSVAQKRRSFNAMTDAQIIPTKHVITNDQLHQHMQNMTGSRLRGGLNSPLYYNLYQSTSNFSNFYIYRFDERSNALNALQFSGVHPNASQNSYLSLDGNNIACSDSSSPGRQQKSYVAAQQILLQQHMQQQLSGNASFAYQSRETGRIYHINKNVENNALTIGQFSSGTGYANGGMSVPTGIGSTKPPSGASTNGGPFGQRRSGPRDPMQIDSLNSVGTGRESIKLQNQLHQSIFPAQHSASIGASGSSAIYEFSHHPMEQMRHSQQPQAVQPMIFNFFNAKSEIKQKSHNRNQRQTERNVQIGSTQQVLTTVNQARSQDTAGLNRNVKIIGPNEPRKPPSIPSRPSNNLLDANITSALNAQNQTFQASGQHNSISLNPGTGMNTTIQKQSPSVNERYPIPNSKVYRDSVGAVANINSSQGGGNNVNLIRQRTTTDQVGASQSSNTLTGGRLGKQSGVSQKSRSNLQQRKQPLKEASRDKDEIFDEQLVMQSSLDIKNSKNMPQMPTSSVAMTEKQTRSAKFGKIVAAAEQMVNQSQVDFHVTHAQGFNIGQTANNHFQTLPKKQHIMPQLPQAPVNPTRLVLNQMHQSLVGGQNHNGSFITTNEKIPVSKVGEQQLMGANDLKRNAIRKIHLLNTFNGTQNANQKTLPNQQDVEIGKDPLNRLSAQASSQNMAILRDQSHQMHVDSVTKRNSSKNAILGQIQQANSLSQIQSDELIDSMPAINYMLKLPKTSATKQQQQQQLNEPQIAGTCQQVISKDFADKKAPFQIGQQTILPIGNDYALDPNLKLHQESLPYTSQYKSNMPISSLPSRDTTSSRGGEPRRQMSQYNVLQDMADHSSVEGCGTSSSFCYNRKDPRYHINDHESPLLRSGDYQTKTMKHLQMEAASNVCSKCFYVTDQQNIHRMGKASSYAGIENCTMKQQPSQEVDAANRSNKVEIIGNMSTGDHNVNNIRSNQTVRMRTAQKQSFGQRVPPELYQKNPYSTMSGTNCNKNQPHMFTQRIAQPHTNSKSELINVTRQNNADPSNLLVVSTKGASSLAAIDANNLSLMHEEINSLSTPHNVVHQSSYQPSVTAGIGFMPSDMQNIQNTALIPNSQMAQSISNYQRSLNQQQQPQLTKSKTSLNQHQLSQHQQHPAPPGGIGLQSSLIQGVNQIFAGESKFGMNNMTEQVSQSPNKKPLNVSRRLKSPREQDVTQSRKGSRDYIANLWNKSGIQQQSFEKINDTNDASLPSDQRMILGQSDHNGSIIRVQNSKYPSSMIVQRGIPGNAHGSIVNDAQFCDRSQSRFQNCCSPSNQQTTYLKGQQYPGVHQHLKDKHDSPSKPRHALDDLQKNSKINHGINEKGVHNQASSKHKLQQQIQKQFSISSKQPEALISNEEFELIQVQPLSSSSTVKGRGNRGYVSAQKRVTSDSRKKGTISGGQSLSISSPQASVKVNGGGTNIDMNCLVEGVPTAQLAILSYNQQPGQPIASATVEQQAPVQSKRRLIVANQPNPSSKKYRSEIKSGSTNQAHSSSKKQQPGMTRSRNRGRSSFKSSKPGSLQRQVLAEADSQNM